MIPDAAVEAAAAYMHDLDCRSAVHSGHPADFECYDWMTEARELLEAAAPRMATFSAVAAVRRLHRALPCVDEEGDPVGGFYCEECTDLDDHSGERVHEVYPCLTIREVDRALAGDETWTAMRDRIERGAQPA